MAPNVPDFTPEVQAMTWTRETEHVFEHDQGSSSGPLQIIGGLGGLVTALSAYVYSLRARLAKKTGEAVSLQSAIEEILDGRLRTLTGEMDRRVKSIVDEAIAHDQSTAERFSSVDRRLQRLENVRLEDKREMFDLLSDMKREIGEMGADIRALKAASK